MKAITIAVIAVLAASVFGLTGYSCTDTTCTNCTENKPNPNATVNGDCTTLNGQSSKAFCSSGNATMQSFGNSDCSGTPATSISYPADKCIPFTTSSMKITCGSSAAAAVVAVAAVVAALLF